jgi:pimeloyl-ACP methyl ester carboxylesterase
MDVAISKRLADVVSDYKLADSPSLSDMVPIGSMRRRRGYVPQNSLATLALVREDGLLRWVYQPPARGQLSRRARWPADRRIGAEPVYQFSIKETPPNQVISSLEKLDERLTPKQGLRRFNTNTREFEPADKLKVAGRVLLLVHGTFSKSEMFIDEMNSIASGRDFLQRVSQPPHGYHAILAFDHPTLSVSPWINAIDLEEALENVPGPIDIICHSRGGLVVAWWIRNPKRQVDKVIFVGAPLEGTSLASPASLRGALQVFANVWQGLECAGALASTIVPFAAAVTGLSKILGGVLRLGASTPLADAAIVVVPGLAGQSRVGNNAELLRLHKRQWLSTPIVHAVISNFQPWDTDAAWWEVWKHLKNPGDKVLDWGAEAIFKGKNDLVVDTESMSRICEGAIAKTQIYDYGDSAKVHHCNYFSQDETVAFLRQALKL